MEDRESRLEAVCEQIGVQKRLRLLGTDLIAGLDRLTIVMAGLAWVNLIALIV